MNQPAYKNALITGGAVRIGRSIALALAKEGWNIVIHYNTSHDEAIQLANEISTIGMTAHILQANLEHIDDVESLILKATTIIDSPITTLINNASIFIPDVVTNDFLSNTKIINTKNWDDHLNINLKAPALIMRDFAQQFDHIPHKSANIINIIDQRVCRLTPHFISYTVSKAGLWTLTQTFAQALAPRNIRVNAVAPGPTLPSTRQDNTNFKKQTQSLPLGNAVSINDITNAIQYLLTAQSVTGQMIIPDSGQHIAWQTPDIINSQE